MTISRPAGTFLARRLHNQKLTASQFSRPEQVVLWMGAVQSQDYAGAKWAVGNRAPGVTDAHVERAIIVIEPSSADPLPYKSDSDGASLR